MNIYHTHSLDCTHTTTHPPTHTNVYNIQIYKNTHINKHI